MSKRSAKPSHKPLLGRKVAAALRRSRRSNGWLARATGIDKVTIGRIVNGKAVSTDYRNVFRISSALHRGLYYLMDDTLPIATEKPK